MIFTTNPQPVTVPFTGNTLLTLTPDVVVPVHSFGSFPATCQFGQPKNLTGMYGQYVYIYVNNIDYVLTSPVISW